MASGIGQGRSCGGRRGAPAAPLRTAPAACQCADSHRHRCHLCRHCRRFSSRSRCGCCAPARFVYHHTTDPSFLCIRWLIVLMPLAQRQSTPLVGTRLPLLAPRLRKPLNQRPRPSQWRSRLRYLLIATRLMRELTLRVGKCRCCSGQLQRLGRGIGHGGGARISAAWVGQHDA
jgi:hypothetical protein